MAKIAPSAKSTPALRRSSHNACRADQIEPLDPVDEAPRREARVSMSSRVHNEDTRLWIVQTFEAWVRGGKKREDSPIAKIMRKTGCSSHYPSQLYQQWVERGSLDPKWAGGRPPRF